MSELICRLLQAYLIIMFARIILSWFPMQPGTPYRFEIDLVGTSVAFLKGHRIRVQIASSHFPQFDRNPNTGDPFGTSET